MWQPPFVLTHHPVSLATRVTSVLVSHCTCVPTISITVQCSCVASVIATTPQCSGQQSTMYCFAMGCSGEH